MHSKHCIINNLQGRYLRSPSDCELTQDSDRKNAHNLGSTILHASILQSVAQSAVSICILKRRPFPGIEFGVTNSPTQCSDRLPNIQCRSRGGRRAESEWTREASYGHPPTTWEYSSGW